VLAVVRLLLEVGIVGLEEVLLLGVCLVMVEVRHGRMAIPTRPRTGVEARINCWHSWMPKGREGRRGAAPLDAVTVGVFVVRVC
jgi:hypothetical protein